ncbi:MAG: hypothetical protein FRX49_00975 [Trebouxia sp. A1-2]|nr:MAG: hypothetical protein FRX49_00975 [Trebouxia sp. A1-2]
MTGGDRKMPFLLDWQVHSKDRQEQLSYDWQAQVSDRQVPFLSEPPSEWQAQMRCNSCPTSRFECKRKKTSLFSPDWQGQRGETGRPSPPGLQAGSASHAPQQCKAAQHHRPCFQSGLGILKQLRGPGGLQKGQLNVQGPAYCIQGVVKGNHEGIPFCCHLQWAIKGAQMALTVCYVSKLRLKVSSKDKLVGGKNDRDTATGAAVANLIAKVLGQQGA